MTWRVIAVNQHSKLSYQNNALIFKNDTGVEKIHLSEIHTLMVETTNVSLTSALIAKIVEYKIKLIFCDEKRLPTAELVPYYGCHDSSKRLHEQLLWNHEQQKIVWTEVIRQKINNQAQHLFSQGKIDEGNLLKSYLDQLVLFDETNREGHAAKVYFNALFGKNFTRDRANDINAGLDYGYALILSIVSREIVKNGCLTQLGLKHSNPFNAFNLASDLMEPFRPLVDAIVVENQTLEFPKIKRQLFRLFSETYLFEGKAMYLVNIIEIYVKKCLTALSETSVSEIPVFDYTWEGK
jgi:CRISPR-associated endonuclease Cas1 subtype II